MGDESNDDSQQEGQEQEEDDDGCPGRGERRDFATFVEDAEYDLSGGEEEEEVPDDGTEK